MNQQNLNVSNDILARLFFRRLWQKYDSGGVSAGRSLKSDLIDGYLELVELPLDDKFPFGMEEFAREAERRVPIISKQPLLGDLNSLPLFPSSDIAMLCIEALRVWYSFHVDETDRNGYVANPWEKKFIDMVVRIMPIPYFPFIKSDKDIILIKREGHERIRIQNVYEMSRQIYQ